MLNINIESIPDSEQRYNTVADYTRKGNSLTITVSDMGDWRQELLLAVHELVESALCKQRGISIEEIDAFDMQYTGARLEGDISEPGDSTDAPYHKEHLFATKIEQDLAKELDVEWKAYDQKAKDLNES